MRIELQGAALLATLILAGCGGAPTTNAQGGADAGAPAVTAAGGGGWDARDACATLGRDAAAKAGGAPVTEMKNEEISAGDDVRAAVSTCTFDYPGGAKLILLTREAPDADSTPEAIENARTGGGMMPPSDPVPGLGKAAFWGEKAKQLQLFLDDRRYVAINFYLPGGGDAKARSIAVAKALP